MWLNPRLSNILSWLEVKPAYSVHTFIYEGDAKTIRNRQDMAHGSWRSWINWSAKATPGFTKIDKVEFHAVIKSLDGWENGHWNSKCFLENHGRPIPSFSTTSFWMSPNMGAQAQVNNHAVDSTEFKGLLHTFCNHGWNVDPPFHIGDKGTVEAVDLCRPIGYEESKDRSIGLKGHGNNSLEFARW